MQRSTTWWGWIYLGWFYTVLAVTLIVLYPIILFGLRKRSRNRMAHRVRRQGCRFVLFVTGIRSRFPESPVWPKQPVLYLANHTSLLDILVGLAVIPQPVLYVGKAELSKIPIFGQFFKYLDIPVERGNAERGEWVMQQVEDRMRNGWSVVWFPEGTTSAIAPDLLKFKNGAFRLAVRAQFPVVPLTFVDHWHLQHYDHPGDNRPGINRIVLGGTHLPGHDDNAVQRLRDRVRYEMDNTLTSYWPAEMHLHKLKEPSGEN